MKWIEKCSARRNILRILILTVIGSLFVGGTFHVTAEMSNLSDKEMQSVTGQEGITVDISLRGSTNYLSYVDADGAANVTSNAGYGRLRLGGGSGKKITFGDGSGNPISLTGMTVDIDGNNNIVIGLPQGDMTVDVPWASIVDSTTSPGAGNSFGQFTTKNLSVGNTTVKLDGKNDGLNINMDVGINADRVRYRDPDGSSQDVSPGNVTLKNVSLGDYTSNSPATLTGLEVDIDGNEGIGITFPSSSNLKLQVGDIMAGGSSFGRFRIDGMNWDGSNLQLQPNNDGIDGQFNFKYSANAVEFRDRDGFGGSSSAADIIGLQNLEIGASPWSGLGNETVNFKLDADANRGLVFRTDDTDQTFDVRIGDLNVGGSSSLGLVDLSDVNVGHNELSVQPTNTGIEIDGQLAFSVDFEVRYKDLDGNSGNSAGHIALGRTTNGVSLQAEFGGEKVSFNDLKLNADPSNGLVLKPFSEEFTFEVKDVYVGNAAGPWNSFGSVRGKEMDFEGSRFEISGKGDGVNVDGALDFQAEEFRYTDGDGISDPDFSGASGTLQFCDNDVECITLDDGNGNPASFSNFQIDADSNEGLVVQAPSMSTYQLTVGEVTIAPGSGPSVPIEPLKVNNIDPGGSWFKVDPR